MTISTRKAWIAEEDWAKMTYVYFYTTLYYIVVVTVGTVTWSAKFQFQFQFKGSLTKNAD